jgi:hypothetical protein
MKICIAALPVALCVAAGIAMAQTPASPAGDGFPKFAVIPPPKPADPKSFPRMNGKPDFTGIWQTNLMDYVPRDKAATFGGSVNLFGGVPESELPSLTPAYAAKRDAWLKAAKEGHPPSDSVTRCQAFGLARLMGMMPLEFLQTGNRQLIVISEILHQVRHIYMDGRTVEPDADPSYSGQSIGHWEGDTLVVETTDLNAADADIDGTWLSDKARITERFVMVNPDGIEDVLTVNDPVALTKPWTVTHYYARAPKGTEIEEYVCENNHDA